MRKTIVKIISVVLSLTLIMTFMGCSEEKDDSLTVTWVDYDGTVLEVDSGLKVGDVPTFDGDEPFRKKDENGTYYKFAGWDNSIPKKGIKESLTMTAKYKPTELFEKLATTTEDFYTYCDNDKQRIYELYKAGFRYIDLSMYYMRTTSDYMRPGWQDLITELKEYADSLGMEFVQAHSPGGNPFSTNPDEVNDLIRVTKRSIEICGMLGIKNIVVHCGFVENKTRAQYIDMAKNYYSNYIEDMERYGVNVLCENDEEKSLERIRFNSYGLFDAQMMLDIISAVNHPNFHACWDTGHANIQGAQYDQILKLGKELYAIHYNDNDGEYDKHTLPYFGTLNHDEVIKALKEIGFKGFFTFECTYGLITGSGRKNFTGDGTEKLREPTITMREDLEKYMFNTGKYMLKKYNLLY